MKKIIQKLKKNIANWGATLLGLAVAIAVDVMTINWIEFDIKKEWPKLLCSVVIAVGGYVSKIKMKKDDSGKS